MAHLVRNANTSRWRFNLLRFADHSGMNNDNEKKKNIWEKKSRTDMQL